MANISKEYIELLSRKYADGTLNEKEKADFVSWYGDLSEQLEHSDSETLKVIETRMRTKIYAHLEGNIGTKRKLSINFKHWGVAASILLLCTFGLLAIRINHNNIKKEIDVASVFDIKPGGQKAYLRLSDGRSIDLTATQIGNLAEVNGVLINKSTNNQLIYTGGKQSARYDPAKTNTITTPQGGEYHLVLADGTKVHLNAGSSLTYPENFSNEERTVVLKGEAYFEVAHEKNRPFKVSAGGQLVEVLGTHFNINAYADEPNIITTLVEGSVRVEANHQVKMIKPGEQAVTTKAGAGLHVETAHIRTQLAWKNGFIAFEDANLSQVMRQVSRWYNIKVRFEGKESSELYTGGVSRGSNFSTLLEILKANNITYTLTGEGMTKILIIK